MLVYVIGNEKSVRSSSLRERTRDLGIKFIDGVFLDANLIPESIDQAANVLMLGRKISAGEAGCILAHAKAWSALSEDWALILEDDADVSRLDIGHITESISGLDSSYPTIVTLFDSQSMVRCGSSGLRRLGYHPAGTVGYLINERAASSVPRVLVGTADWPLHTAGFRFYSLWNNAVREEVAGSQIGPTGRGSGNALSFHLSSIIRIPKILLELGWEGVFVGVISPLKRDIVNIFDSVICRLRLSFSPPSIRRNSLRGKQD